MSWLTWWKKDEKKEKEEENEKKINIIGEGNNEGNAGTIIPVKTEYENGWTINTYEPYTYKHLYSGELGFRCEYNNETRKSYMTITNYNSSMNSNCKVILPRVCSIPTSGAAGTGFYIGTGVNKENFNGYYYNSTTYDTAEIVPEITCKTLTCYNSEPKEYSEMFSSPMGFELILNLEEETYEYKENNLMTMEIAIERKATVNKKKQGYDIQLLIKGTIPDKIYDLLLPLSEKGWMNSNGYIFIGNNLPVSHDYHITGINDQFYKVNSDNYNFVDSTLELGSRTDLDLSRFEGVFAKKVNIAVKYKKQIEKEHPFKYWKIASPNSDSATELVDSEITYYNINIVEYIKDINKIGDTLVITFKEMPMDEYYENGFLDYYISESGINYLNIDVRGNYYLNHKMTSMSYWTYDNLQGKLEFNTLISRKEGNQFDIKINTKRIDCIKIICHSDSVYQGGDKYWYSANGTVPIYQLNSLYCVNTTNYTLENSVPNYEGSVKYYDGSSYVNLNYSNLYLTNVKESTTYPATNVNLVVSGDITSCYTALPDGVDTINAPPVPDDYLEGESSMDLSNVKELDLTKFGELDEDGKFIEQEAYPFTSQKIFLSKITVTSGNGDKVKESQMRSSNKMEDADSYALTEIYTVIIMDDSIPTAIQTSNDDNTIDEDTIRIQLYGDDDVKESDCMQDYVDGNTLNIKLNEDLSTKFNASKNNLELYIVTMGMNTFSGDEESNKIEFFSSDVTEVSVHYGEGGNTIKTYGLESTSFTTHLGTLNITYTQSESDSSIQPITYSSNGTVKANGLQSKVSGITLIDTVNSINTIVTGNTITNNRITLVNDGLIPKKMYEDNLPISDNNKRYVKSDGNIVNNSSEGVARLVAINEPPKDKYLTYKSSMNLIDVENVDLSKFGTTTGSGNQVKIDKQNVFLSSILVYSNEVNKKVKSAGLMSRNVAGYGRTLSGEPPVYLSTNVDLQRDDIVDRIYEYELIIKEQNCNNFLKSVTENESGTETIYTDVYLNATCSSSFQENSENMLRVSNLLLLNEYTITFNCEENMGKLRIHYLKSNPTEEDRKDDYGYVVYIPSNPKYQVNNLYITSGVYKDNTSNLIPHPVDWTEGSDNYHVFNRTEENGEIKMSINLMYKKGLTYVVNVSSATCINTLVTDENKSYECYLIISGEIPQWVFKDLLPLPKSIDEQGNIVDTNTYKTIQGINTSVGNVGVSKIDNTDKLTESEINLTNVADLDVLDRVYYFSNESNQKAFFVNKITLLERFKDKIPDGVFKYYEGTTLKDCVYNEEDPSSSDITYVDDWALKLPECYEGCEVSGTELTVKFGEYLQIGNGYDNHLFEKLCKSERYYLDLSMKMNSNLNLDNITTLNIYLDILKYISDSVYVALARSKEIWVIYNKDGFLKNKVIEINNVKQEIDYCYLIHETNISKIDTKNILIKPASDVFSSKNNIILHDYLTKNIRMTINNLKCTNIFQHMDLVTIIGKFPPKTEVNLLVSGSIPKWLNEYFYNENKALPIRVESGSNGTCKLAEPDGGTEVSTDYFMITSINDTPAPGIGIDNSDPKDQCSLNLEDFMPEQPDSGGTGDDGDNPSG